MRYSETNKNGVEVKKKKDSQSSGFEKKTKVTVVVVVKEWERIMDVRGGMN